MNISELEYDNAIDKLRKLKSISAKINEINAALQEAQGNEIFETPEEVRMSVEHMQEILDDLLIPSFNRIASGAGIQETFRMFRG